MNQRLKILIVDDEASQRSGLAAMVSAWGMTPETAADGNEALEKLNEFAADVILTDLNMPGLDGFGFLQRLREGGDMPPTIVLTAYGNIETAVKTVHELGAYWFLEKPLQPSTLEVLIRRAGSHAELRSEKRVLERNLVYKGSLGEMVGMAPRMQEIFALLQQAGPSKACVLITGESGTGKELVARAIHFSGNRVEKPFIIVSCAALTETLLESELFGYEKGAFTGAAAQTKGKFELADGGTIFLDEIGDISAKLQADLLRVLEERRFYRVGGNEEVKVDVRIIAATNKNLAEEVHQGRFREDLYYRLNVIEIRIPPLRERREDIPLLAEHFVQRISSELGKDISGISAAALKVLITYDWPGNVRELENVIERALVTCRSSTLDEQDFSWLQLHPGSLQNWEVPDVPLDELERLAITAALERKHGNIKEASAALGIDRSTLYDKLKRYEISH